VLVTVREPGPLGVPSGFLRVANLSTNLEHEPWRSVPSLDGVIEVRFIRRFHQGSTITPYRSLEPVHAVVPWDEQEGRLLDVGDERLDTFPGLARWWTQASEIWNRLGTPSLYTLTKRVDFQRKLTRQFPIQLNRVVYTASGSHLAAARITDLDAVFSEKLYWATVNADEALYLTAILNSDTLTALVAPYQSRGQFGTRDFHKYVFYVPIPIFDPASAFHQELTQLAKRSEQVAASVSLPAEVNFHMARRRVREALVADGVANEVETRVQQLLR